MKHLLILALLFSNLTKADGIWDHAGTSYAMQMVTYAVASQWLGIGYHKECTKWNYDWHECTYTGAKVHNRIEPIIVSTAITFLATFAYSYAKSLQPGAKLSWGDIGFNSIGQATAIGTIYTFHF
jgi:hypothetical protein